MIVWFIAIISIFNLCTSSWFSWLCCIVCGSWLCRIFLIVDCWLFLLNLYCVCIIIVGFENVIWPAGTLMMVNLIEFGYRFLSQFVNTSTIYGWYWFLMKEGKYFVKIVIVSKYFKMFWIDIFTCMHVCRYRCTQIGVFVWTCLVIQVFP